MEVMVRVLVFLLIFNSFIFSALAFNIDGELPENINNALLNIYNVTGQNLYKTTLNKNETKINLSLTAGTYYVDIEINGVNYRKLLVIK